MNLPTEQTTLASGHIRSPPNFWLSHLEQRAWRVSKGRGCARHPWRSRSIENWAVHPRPKQGMPAVKKGQTHWTSDKYGKRMCLLWKIPSRFPSPKKTGLLSFLAGQILPSWLSRIRWWGVTGWITCPAILSWGKNCRLESRLSKIKMKVPILRFYLFFRQSNIQYRNRKSTVFVT